MLLVWKTHSVWSSTFFSMFFFQVERIFCFEGIPYTWLKSILCQIPTKKYPPAKKKRKPAPPKEFSHGTPKSMGFSVDVFFFPFPRGPLFSASICGVGRNHAFDGWIIQEVDLVEDFHGAVWRLPDGEMARWLLGGAVEGAFFLFLVGPVVTEISSSN